jgi:hypothetical protein
MVFFIITGCQQGAKFYLNLPYLIIMAKFMGDDDQNDAVVL